MPTITKWEKRLVSVCTVQTQLYSNCFVDDLFNLRLGRYRYRLYRLLQTSQRNLCNQDDQFRKQQKLGEPTVEGDSGNVHVQAPECGHLLHFVCGERGAMARYEVAEWR